VKGALSFVRWAVIAGRESESDAFKGNFEVRRA
jgi:hypothetical protein